MTFKHVVCVVGYWNDEDKSIPAKAFSEALGKVVDDQGMMPVSSTTYVSTYDMSPVQAGLRDAWTALNPTEKGFIQVHAGQDLIKAIELMLGEKK